MVLGHMLGRENWIVGSRGRQRERKGLRTAAIYKIRLLYSQMQHIGCSTLLELRYLGLS